MNHCRRQLQIASGTNHGPPRARRCGGPRGGWLLLLAAAAVAGVAGCDPQDSAPAPASASDPDPGPAATEPPFEPAPDGKLRQRTVYVPAYSHLPSGGKVDTEHLLSILLSVRNVDTKAVIKLTHVDYYDTYGHRVRRYLREPRILRPLETAEFGVSIMDKTGGSGANFLVYWEGPADAHSLLTETVMLGRLGAGYVTFTSRGVELDRRPDLSSFQKDAGPPPIEAQGTEK